MLKIKWKNIRKNHNKKYKCSCKTCTEFDRCSLTQSHGRNGHVILCFHLGDCIYPVWLTNFCSRFEPDFLQIFWLSFKLFELTFKGPLYLFSIFFSQMVIFVWLILAEDIFLMTVLGFIVWDMLCLPTEWVYESYLHWSSFVTDLVQ